MQGTMYSFTPNAEDADDDVLTFSISGRPPWASFNAATGRLQGAPTPAHVGTYPNVTIRVTDGADTAALATFSVNVVATATGAVTLTWTPPTENDDGSQLADLSGYKVYWGTQKGSYPNSIAITNPGLSSYVVEQLTPATWYFVLTAVSASGAESEYSNVATKAVVSL
jgi:hypothetical protein